MLLPRCATTAAEPPPLLPTAQKATESGEPTKSAHPARFSPDDKFSRHRITIKKRFNILPTQQEEEKL